MLPSVALNVLAAVFVVAAFPIEAHSLFAARIRCFRETRAEVGKTAQASMGLPAPHRFPSYDALICFLIWRMAFFSSRETCACEMPISPATSIWVRPSKKRRARMCFSLWLRALMA